MPMTKRDKMQYRNKYAAENYDNIRLQVKKDERLPERIETAVRAGKAGSKQAYIIMAVRAALDADGITAATEE